MIGSRILARTDDTLPWYRKGGVSAANVLAAHHPKGAADATAARSNIALPGTRNATTSGNTPSWAAGTGWSFVRASSQKLVCGFQASQLGATPTILIRYSGIVDNVSATNYLFGIASSSTTVYRTHAITRLGATCNFIAGNNAETFAARTCSASGILGNRITGSGTQQRWDENGLDQEIAVTWNPTNNSAPGIGGCYFTNTSTFGAYLTGNIEAIVFLLSATEAQTAAIIAAMALL